MLGRLTVAVALVAIGVVALLDVTGILAPTALHYLGIGLGVIALGLLIGSVRGRAKWLVIPGLLIIPLPVRSPILPTDLGLHRHQPGHEAPASGRRPAPRVPRGYLIPCSST